MVTNEEQIKMAEQAQRDKREYNREAARKWRKNNPQAADTIQMRHYAKRIFSLTPEQIGELLTPKRNK